MKAALQPAARRGGTFAALLAAVALWILAAPAAAALRVSESGGSSTPHDGGKWETAFSAGELQQAIDSYPGEEFWLAKGGYPAIQHMPDGTQIYGGFRGGLLGETQRSERDPSANPTYLDGALITPYMDDSGNEVIQGPLTVIDGLNIMGIGVHVEKATPTLSHDSIHGAPNGLTSINGGGPIVSDSEITGSAVGVYLDGPRRSIKVGGKQVEVRPSIARTTISSSGPSFSSRIGLWQAANDPPTFTMTDVHLSDMTGATPMFLQGDARISNCFVENNTGFGSGGAVNITGYRTGQNVTLDHCAIRNNQGTGLLLHPMASSRIVVSHGEIAGNNAPTPPGVNGVFLAHPGGVLIDSAGVQIVASRITGNRTTGNGGGVYVSPILSPQSTTLIVDSLIAGNHADLQGGGVWLHGAPLQLLESTVANNSAAAGGGLWLEWGTFDNVPPVTISGTAITGNQAAKASAIAWGLAFDATPTLLHDVATLTTDSYASTFNLQPLAAPKGNGNLAVADPGYLNAGAGDYRLSSSSPLVDHGDTAAIGAYVQQGGVATDLAGKPRIAGTAVDVGAYETAQAGITDVTSQVSLQRGGYIYNRVTRRYVQQVTLANSSGGPLAGPVSLVFDGLPQGITVYGQTNVTTTQTPAGSPYSDVAGADLAAGALLVLQLQFNDPFNLPIGYTPRVLAGPGTR